MDDNEVTMMTEWHYNPITAREADIIEAEMATIAERRRKERAQSKARRSKENSPKKPSKEDLEARDAMEFQRLFEKLSRLAPDRELSAPERNARIAALTSTTAGEIWRLRRLRNRIAHDEPFSITDVRKMSTRVEDLLRNAANRRGSQNER